MGTTNSVLIVEDQPDAREMLSEWLSFCGFVVHRAADGIEAVAIAQREHPRVVLMDLMMPRMDGWEATRRLKGDVETKDSTIIAVSAHSHRDEQEKARRAGCDDFIAKPYDIERLTDAVREKLR
jgi:CheY-like chemotaxis protein